MEKKKKNRLSEFSIFIITFLYEDESFYHAEQ